MEEIEKGQNDPEYKLKMSVQGQDTIRRTRGPRYTPVSKRQDKPRLGQPFQRMVQQGHAAHRAERSEEHTSELPSLMRISYAVFCLKKQHHVHHDQTDENQRKDKHKNNQ